MNDQVTIIVFDRATHRQVMELKADPEQAQRWARILKTVAFDTKIVEGNQLTFGF